MPVYDYQCKNCGEIQEIIGPVSSREKVWPCPECGGDMVQIITLTHTAPIDAPWIATVREVVDKDPGKPHCQEFLRHPTRSNYHRWMEKENLRPLEDNEPRRPRVDRAADIAAMKRDLNRINREVTAVEVTT